jgi:hypothetical protein
MHVTIHGKNNIAANGADGTWEPVRTTSGALNVSNQAVEPGMDSTLDRTWGGWKALGNYISTATTTTVKSGPGVLHTIVLTETAAGTITIYDNTAGSGTVIAVLKASIGENTFVFDRIFSTGLTIVTAAASKLHVSYV